MGSSQSNEQNNNETINWNKIKTDKFSPTQHTLNGINSDASKLVLNLNYPEISESSDFNSKYLFTKKYNSAENNNLSITENDNNSTSPFISSEMYKYIVDKYQNQNTNVNANANANANVNANANMQTGGAKNNYSDDSSTSSTSSSKISSSSESSETAEDKKKRRDKKKKGKETIKGGRKTKKSDQPKKKKNNKLSENDLDYISSSAHTVSEKSISDENSISVSSSVRTSQINLISE